MGNTYLHKCSQDKASTVSVMADSLSVEAIKSNERVRNRRSHKQRYRQLKKIEIYNFFQNER